MRSRRLFILGVFIALAVTAILYGVHTGDALYVFRNASNFCFT